jgi:hypothetical protein
MRDHVIGRRHAVAELKNRPATALRSPGRRSDNSAAVHGNSESIADLDHPCVAEAADPIRKHTYGNTLDRVEVDCRLARHWVVAWLKDDFAGKVSDGCCARGNQRTAESGNGCVTREDDNGSAADFGGLAPPQLAPLGERTHVDAAADLNESRSPHSSGSVNGCAS